MYVYDIIRALAWKGENEHKQIQIELSEELAEKAEEILDNYGLEIQSATRMFLKKLTKERSLSFLFAEPSKDYDTPVAPAPRTNPEPDFEQGPYCPEPIPNYPDQPDMRKSIAIRMFRGHRQTVYRNVTFASKNRTSYNYWANPKFTLLDDDWSLILNDWISRKLYLFNIPAGSIAKSSLTSRSDKPSIIDLQICYDDIMFTDGRSGYLFESFLVDTIDY